MLSRRELMSMAMSAAVTEATKQAVFGEQYLPPLEVKDMSNEKDREMFGMGWRDRETRAWTQEDQDRADEYARQNGIGFHNKQMLDTKRKNKQNNRAKAKLQRKARKANR